MSASPEVAKFQRQLATKSDWPATTGDRDHESFGASQEVLMFTHVRSEDLRCSKCRALLAKHVGAALDIKRGSFRATIEGSFSATLCCDQCRHLSLIVSKSKKNHESQGPAS